MLYRDICSILPRECRDLVDGYLFGDGLKMEFAFPLECTSFCREMIDDQLIGFFSWAKEGAVSTVTPSDVRRHTSNLEWHILSEMHQYVCRWSAHCDMVSMSDLIDALTDARLQSGNDSELMKNVQKQSAQEFGLCFHPRPFYVSMRGYGGFVEMIWELEELLFDSLTSLVEMIEERREVKMLYDFEDNVYDVRSDEEGFLPEEQSYEAIVRNGICNSQAYSTATSETVREYERYVRVQCMATVQRRFRHVRDLTRYRKERSGLRVLKKLVAQFPSCPIYVQLVEQVVTSPKFNRVCPTIGPFWSPPTFDQWIASLK